MDDVFLRLKALLEPFGITRYAMDGWGTYERHLDPAQHTVGTQHTQTIESTHITIQTRIKRLVRRTICFSQTEYMHDLVIGLLVNRYECGRSIEHAIHNSDTPSDCSWGVSPVPCRLPHLPLRLEGTQRERACDVVLHHWFACPSHCT